jgi:hypothetical protein
MARTFIAAKGCVYISGGRGGGGFYSLQPRLSGSASAPVLIVGTDSEMADVAFPVTTLDDEQYMYLMGKDMGGITVQGMVLLGESSKGGAAFDKVKRYFEKNRASAAKKPITLSLPGNTFVKFYLTRLIIGQADPGFNLQSFALRGVVVEPKK